MPKNDAHLAVYLDTFPDHRVAVIGDLMLDRYVWGEASRISQEAPVPVVHVYKETEVPGGAANVINNLLALTAHAGAFGVVGQDSHGEQLLQLLRDAGADTVGTAVLADRPTTVKTRVVANKQQIVRIDAERVDPLPAAVTETICQQLMAALAADQYDAVIFEDYAKGMLTADLMQNLVNAASQRNIMTALDPHPGHAFDVKGLTVMTPNRAEAFGLAGLYYQPGGMPVHEDKALQEVGQRLHQRWEVAYLLITLGADGMALFCGEDPVIHIPTRARDVFDVSGAGDTVTASLILALLSEATPAEAARISNHAAGIVVGEMGTLPVHLADLAASLKEGHE